MKNISKAFRLALTLALLFQVWTHAHWSVAVSLMLVTISIESIAISLDILARAHRALHQTQARD
jgi:hypothetical protein